MGKMIECWRNKDFQGWKHHKDNNIKCPYCAIEHLTKQLDEAVGLLERMRNLHSRPRYPIYSEDTFSRCWDDIEQFLKEEGR